MDQLERLEQKIKQLKQRKRKLLAREREQRRKLRTRGLILLAGDLLAEARSRDGLRAHLERTLRAHAERTPRDRAACEAVLAELTRAGERANAASPAARQPTSATAPVQS